MPIYEYRCEDCGKDFTESMRITEHGQVEITCEHCRSTNVRQTFSRFYVKTAKKS